MKVSGITSLGNSVYELKKGVSDQKLRIGDVVELQLGGIETASITRKLTTNTQIFLPFLLQEENLINLSMDYNGYYKDQNMERQRVCDVVLTTIRTMKVGQKVLIVEEDVDREEFFENGEIPERLWVVQLSQINGRIFSRFQDMAIELQNAVWEVTFSQRRTFDDDTLRILNPQNGMMYSYLTPYALNICYNSRTFAQSRLRRTLLFRRSPQGSGRTIYFNPNRDVCVYLFTNLSWCEDFILKRCEFRNVEIIANVSPDKLASAIGYGLRGRKFSERFPDIKRLLIREKDINLEGKILWNGWNEDRWNEESKLRQNSWDAGWKLVEEVFKDREIELVTSQRILATDGTKEEFIATFPVHKRIVPWLKILKGGSETKQASALK
ncbi:hypothetical protein BJ875DRAFT_488888 [Amylocarpus encephaloides]|uniref:2EXR domain-containing protein n=1 Tax=Amylocarpus encephaloides TaxID=45428 RepID=A0A9P7Y9E7_9HELO|nr:hypothetical protein BJ875DRAFT_488888 [Amylocarpus encephaloides]